MKTKVVVTRSTVKYSSNVGDVGYIDGYVYSKDNIAFAIVIINYCIRFIPLRYLMVIDEKTNLDIIQIEDRKFIKSSIGSIYSEISGGNAGFYVDLIVEDRFYFGERIPYERTANEIHTIKSIWEEKMNKAIETWTTNNQE